MKRNSSTTNNYGVVNDFSVDRVRQTKGGVYFTLILNGVTINNCRVVESKDYGDFISLPSYKSSNGEYYNTVFFKFSKADTENILSLVEKMLNE